MWIIPVMLRPPKINLQVKSDALIYRKLTKSPKISKHPINLLASALALHPLASYIIDRELRTLNFYSDQNRSTIVRVNITYNTQYNNKYKCGLYY